jgi:hypothetical protein
VSGIIIVVSVADIISAISDEKVLSLFKAISFSENDSSSRSSILITKLTLTRKQYYSSIENLVHSGLVRRIRGKYSLTLLGKIIFSSILKIETAIECYWKLKAIDSIMNVMSANIEVPAEEYQRIVDNIIDNNEIKAVLLSNNNNNNNSASTTIATPTAQQQQIHESKQERKKTIQITITHNRVFLKLSLGLSKIIYL